MITPEIWFKSQRVLRTIVQALIILVPVVNGVGIAAVAYLREQTDIVIPASVFLVINAVVAVTALLMGLAARIMAVPGVNDILTRVGLGSVPKSRVDGNRVVLPDPKVVSRSTYQDAVDELRRAGLSDEQIQNGALRSVLALSLGAAPDDRDDSAQ